MRKVYRISLFVIILFHVDIVMAQARIVLNGGVSMVIDNGAKVVIENPSPAALLTVGSFNKIISESEDDAIVWKIGSATDTYNVPFAKPGGGSVRVSLQITSAGSSDGQIKFSTYGTSNSNTPYPSGVTNMTVVNPTAMDGSLSVVDRFWIIDADSYTSKPNIDLYLFYDNSEIGGANLIDVNSLKLQRWANTTWGSVAFGMSNPASQFVSASIDASDLYPVWILESSSIPLNISYSEIVSDNSQCVAEFEIKEYIPDGMSRLKISKSRDGETWFNVGYLDGCVDDRCVFVDANPYMGLSYYKFENQDENGTLDLFEIQSFHSSCEPTIGVYPNPTDSKINILYPTSCNLKLMDALGRVIGFYQTTPGQFELDLSFLVKGEYILSFTDDNGTNIMRKLTKM